MNPVRAETAARDNGDLAIVRTVGIKPGSFHDAIMTSVPTKPDGSRDWQRQGWRAIAVTRRRCIVFKRRLQPTEVVGRWLHSQDPVLYLLQHGVPPTVADRLHLRSVVLAMNLVVDHVELLMEMHAGLPGVAASRHATTPQSD